MNYIKIFAKYWSDELDRYDYDRFAADYNVKVDTSLPNEELDQFIEETIVSKAHA